MTTLTFRSDEMKKAFEALIDGISEEKDSYGFELFVEHFEKSFDFAKAEDQDEMEKAFASAFKSWEGGAYFGYGKKSILELYQPEADEEGCTCEEKYKQDKDMYLFGDTFWNANF